MQIKELISSNIYDENEHILILDVNKRDAVDKEDKIILYIGRFGKIPNRLSNMKIFQISAVSEIRKKKLNLNQCGWTEILIER